MLYFQGKLEEALTMHEKSLNIKVKVFVSDHLDVAKTKVCLSEHECVFTVIHVCKL